MARGREAHRARVAEVAALGKVLSRRARSQCELCGVRTSLKVHEVAGALPEPSADWALLLCNDCVRLVDGGAGEHARFLTETCWSELHPAQITAVRLLRRLDTPWATEALESLYLDPEVEALL